MTQKREMLSDAANVVWAMAKERFAKAPARSVGDVPRDGSDLTLEWLTAVLCRDVPGAEVISWSNPSGSSGTSERMALKVQYNSVGADAGLPTDLYTKTTASLKQRIILGFADGLHGETRFFTDFRPSVNMEAAQGYWGNVDESSWRSIVVMEDLAATRGAKFIDATEPLSRSQVEDVLSNLAAMHGVWWNSPELKTLRNPTEHIDNIEALISFKSRCKVGMKRAIDVIPSELQGQADRLAAGTRRSLEILTDAVPTLLHGDCHVGQTYITESGDMGLTDWQILMQGGWAYDFAYFVGSACEPEDRRAWERELLQFYLDELSTKGGDAPDFESAWLSYRQSMFYPYSAWAFTIGRAPYQPKMQKDDTCRSIIRRTATAIADLDSLGAVGL